MELADASQVLPDSLISRIRSAIPGAIDGRRRTRPTQVQSTPLSCSCHLGPPPGAEVGGVPSTARLACHMMITLLPVTESQDISCHSYFMPQLLHATVTSCHSYFMPQLLHATVTSCHSYFMPQLLHATVTSCHSYFMPQLLHATVERNVV